LEKAPGRCNQVLDGSEKALGESKEDAGRANESGVGAAEAIVRTDEAPGGSSQHRSPSDEVGARTAASRFASAGDAVRPTETGFQSTEVRFASAEARFQSTEARFQSTEARFQSTEARFQSTEARFQSTEAAVASTEAGVPTPEVRFASTEVGFASTEVRFQSTEVRFQSTEAGSPSTGSRFRTADASSRLENAVLSNDSEVLPMVHSTNKPTRSLAALALPGRIHALIAYATAVVDGMTGNPLFPTPTLPLATVSAAIDDLKDAQTAAMTRAMGTVATRNARRHTVITMLHLLRIYVQSVADGNAERAPAVIRSAGMAVYNTAGRRPRVFAAFAGAQIARSSRRLRREGVVFRGLNVVSSARPLLDPPQRLAFPTLHGFLEVRALTSRPQGPGTADR
jgi:hypothetical protein